VSLQRQIEAWIAADPDPVTRAEIQGLADMAFGAKTGRAAQTGQASQAAPVDRPGRADHTGQIKLTDQIDQADQTERTDQIDQTDQADRPDEAGQADQTELADQIDQTGQTDQTDQVDQIDQSCPAARAALAELQQRFAKELAFGTSGLRGAMGGGPNRINLAVVIRAAAGLMAYLRQRLDQARPKVVIGFDARRGSKEFALATAQVVVAAGGEAHLFKDLTPTPLLAFAVRHLRADAGVQVTASHNPAGDNGYKIYLGGRLTREEANGVQIVPPADSEIAAAIALQPPANQVPRQDQGWQVIEDKLRQAYLDQATPGRRPLVPLRIVHTAMHGVGAALALAAFRRAGFDEVHPVAAQQSPDPNFSTVTFPNPEEPGALDMALKLAQRVRAEIVIAHDPDADRCAVAVKDPRSQLRGGWRVLSGDEVGALLGEAAAAEWAGLGGLVSVRPPVLASSLVSSRLLEKIAAHHGTRFESTLTGFKWVGRVEDLLFGYEEAIGYCCRPDMVRDKDGITAGLAVAALAVAAKSKGRTLIQLLDDLARRHGLHLTSQVAARYTNASAIPEVMGRIRQSPPAALGGLQLQSVVDLASASAKLPPTDAVVLELAKQARVIVRPSGTEPKVKCYLEVIQPVKPEASFAQVTTAREEAAAQLRKIVADLRSLLAN